MHYKWGQSRTLPRSQAGKARQARVLVVTLKPPVMWGVEVQRHLRQIPRLQSGSKEALLGSNRAEETAQGKSAREVLRWCKERQERRARDDKGDPVKNRRGLTLEELRFACCVDNEDDQWYLLVVRGVR